MQRYKTEMAWFRCLVRHPARKRSVSILTTSEPARGWLSKGYEDLCKVNTLNFKKNLALHASGIY